MTNADLARQGFEALQRGETEAIRDLLDPEVKWHGGDPEFEGACHNRDQAMAMIEEAVVAGLLPKLVDVVDKGDKVVVVLRPRMQDHDVANVSTFRDGKVVEMVHYPDVEEALASAST
jgi:ketosteroid isomerase-like protein